MNTTNKVIIVASIIASAVVGAAMAGGAYWLLAMPNKSKPTGNVVPTTLPVPKQMPSPPVFDPTRMLADIEGSGRHPKVTAEEWTGEALPGEAGGNGVAV